MSADLESRAFRRHGNSLVPSDEYADESLHSIPDGKEVLVTLRRSRSIQELKWWWKLMRRVVENTDNKWPTPEALCESLKLAAGHVMPVMKLDGSVTLVPKSMALDKMDEDAFKRFKERCLFLLDTQVLGYDPLILMGDSVEKVA